MSRMFPTFAALCVGLVAWLPVLMLLQGRAPERDLGMALPAERISVVAPLGDGDGDGDVQTTGRRNASSLVAQLPQGANEVPTQFVTSPPPSDQPATRQRDGGAPSAEWRIGDERARDMTLADAALLGVVEGLTEFLPVSSTGHLVVTQRALGIGIQDARSKTAADAFTICIQAGAILAVLGLYRDRTRSLARGLIGRDQAGRRLAVCLLVSVIPAVLTGLLLEKTIKRWLFGGDELGLWPIVAAWIAGGIAILVSAAGQRGRVRRLDDSEPGITLEQLTWRRALLIGLLQCVAMWPGVSRSLMTILGGSIVRLRMSATVEFSFLLGVVTLGGATIKDAIEYGPLMWQTFGPWPLLIGMVSSTLSAVVAVRWMVHYLQRHGLHVFGYYRIAVGLAVATLLLLGKL